MMILDEIKKQIFIDSEEVCGNTMIDAYQAQEYIDEAYNKAIDDFKNKWDSRVKDLISWCEDCRLIGLQQADSIFDETAEQLKAGGNNGC